VRSKVRKYFITVALALTINLLLFVALAFINRSSVLKAEEKITVIYTLSLFETATLKTVFMEKHAPIEQELEITKVQLDMPIPKVEAINVPDLHLNFSLSPLASASFTQNSKKAKDDLVNSIVQGVIDTTLLPPTAQGIMDADTVSQPPRELHTPKPAYPRIALRRNLEGYVLVKILINKEGRVEKIELLDWAGYSGFKPVVLDTLKTWRYQPAIHNGQVVKVRGIKKITFKIEDR